MPWALSKNSDNKESGFALAETLIALVVASIAAIGFANILSYHARNAAAQKDYVAKHDLAFRVFDEYGFRAVRSGEKIDGQDEFSGLDWEIVAQHLESFAAFSAEQPSLYQVSVTIANDDGETVLVLSRLQSGPRP